MDPVAADMAGEDVSLCHNSALGWQRNDMGFNCRFAGRAAAGSKEMGEIQQPKW